MANNTRRPGDQAAAQDVQPAKAHCPTHNLAFGTSLACWRRLRGLKQSHVAELCGTSQASYSRLERGTRQPLPHEHLLLRSLMAARPDSASDQALLRLVRNSSTASHLICDLTHRLLCASPAREREWRVSSTSLTGTSLWCYASDEIMKAETRLNEVGWFDQANNSLELETGENDSSAVPIRAGRTRWTRMQLADGSFARLVESIGHQI